MQNSSEKNSANTRLEMLVEWKKFAIMSLLQSLKPAGNILQIGFISKEVSDYIQGFHPKSHIIIESDPQQSEKVNQWSASNKNCKIISENWEAALSKLENFDCIIFSDETEETKQDTLHYFDKDHMQNINEQSNKLIDLLSEKMAQVKVKFTDEQVEDFYENVGKNHLKELPKFFQNLLNNGNITAEQHQKITKKYLKGAESTAQSSTQTDQQNAQTPPKKDTLTDCIETFLTKHLSKEGRFVTFSANTVSKYENTAFFEKVITNPSFDYREEVTPLTVHSETIDTLLITIQKVV